MDYHKCCCLRIVVIFLALSSCIMVVSDAIRVSGKIKPGKGIGPAEVSALPIQERFPQTSSRDGKKLLEVREVIGSIKVDYPGSESKRQAVATP